MVQRSLLIAVLLLPAAAWAFIKPVRVVAPRLTGVSCSSEFICTDAPARYPEAAALYDEAVHFVDSAAGPIEKKPRVTFCATAACFQAFGLGKRSAATIGTLGIVISPRAWKPYYVRHEMFHHLQYEQLGMIKVWRGPEWFIEGMAYAFSEDPRPRLSESFEHDRSRFKNWYRQVGKQQLWIEASHL